MRAAAGTLPAPRDTCATSAERQNTFRHSIPEREHEYLNALFFMWSPEKLSNTAAVAKPPSHPVSTYLPLSSVTVAVFVVLHTMDFMVALDVRRAIALAMLWQSASWFLQLVAPTFACTLGGSPSAVMESAATRAAMLVALRGWW